MQLAELSNRSLPEHLLVMVEYSEID